MEILPLPTARIQKNFLDRGVASSHPLTSVDGRFRASCFRKQIGVKFSVRLSSQKKKKKKG